MLQSLASTKGAACVQPQPRGTVHHYPSHCNSIGSSTSNNNNTVSNERVGSQCTVDSDARYGVPVQVKNEIKPEGGKKNS